MYSLKIMLLTSLGLFSCASPGDKEPTSRESPGEVLRGTSSDTPRETASEVPTALPGVTEFFAAHPKYGSIREVQPMPDWAQGARQQVVTTVGEYLVYLKGSTVVTVYANDENGRQELWRKPGH